MGLDLDFKTQSLGLNKLDQHLVWEPEAAAESRTGPRSGPGTGLQTPIFGFEEPGLRPGLGTSSCTWIWTSNPKSRV